MDRKYQCPNCGARYSDIEAIFNHEICDHLTCYDCGENHTIICTEILQKEIEQLDE